FPVSLAWFPLVFGLTWSCRDLLGNIRPNSRVRGHVPTLMQLDTAETFPRRHGQTCPVPSDTAGLDLFRECLRHCVLKHHLRCKKPLSGPRTYLLENV